MSKSMFDDNFMRACEENQVDVVRKYLSKGYDANQQSHDYWFGLLFAAYYDYPDLCDLLLAQPGTVIQKGVFGIEIRRRHEEVNVATFMATTLRVLWVMIPISSVLDDG